MGGGDRPTPGQSAAHLPKRSRRDQTKPLCGRLNWRRKKRGRRTAPQTSITVHFQSRLNLSFTNDIPMYPPWNSRHPKNKQRKDNQSSLKVKDRAMLKTIWESDKEKRNCLVYLGTKRKTQSRSPSLLGYRCNKERNPRKNRKDLRSPRSSITHYPGGKNTIQKSV